MSGYNYESDSDDDFRQDNSGGGLRKQLEETLAELKALREANSNIQRTNTVTDLLKDYSLDPAIATLIPKDVDAKEWLDANGRLFARSVDPADQEEAVSDSASVSNDDDPAVVLEREARDQMVAAEQAGIPVVTQSDVDKVKAMSAEDILAAIKASQGLNG